MYYNIYVFTRRAFLEDVLALFQADVLNLSLWRAAGAHAGPGGCRARLSGHRGALVPRGAPLTVSFALKRCEARRVGHFVVF